MLIRANGRRHVIIETRQGFFWWMYLCFICYPEKMLDIAFDFAGDLARVISKR